MTKRMPLSKPQTLAVLRDGDVVPKTLQNAYVAIGNFDGVHLGHQYLVGVMRKRARQAGKPAAVLTFEPHPRQFFKPEAPFFRLSPVSAKQIILQRLGVDGLFVRAFNAELAGKSAEQFIAMLRQDLAVAGIVVGHDFHFGRNREGTPERLRALCAEQSIEYMVVEPFRDAGRVVSSSLIRDALAAGDVVGANRLLGYRWFVSGTVVHGAKRGRELGFPTANLELEAGCELCHGVYSVRAAVAGGDVYDGVANFGRRPMFDNGAALLEVHLFGFDGDLYGRVLNVELVDRIRAELRFASLAELVAAMTADAETARSQLKRDGEISMIA